MMSRLENIVRGITKAVRTVWLSPVYLYRKIISPYKRTPSCRFTPTCSAYAVDAVCQWGIVIGTALAVWRVLRCNPFCKGGYDPVPTPPWKKQKQTDDTKKTEE